MCGFGLVSVLRDRQVSNVPFLIVLLLLAVFAYRFMKKLVFNLADEVLDAGNALVVRSGGQEERIALFHIQNVNYSPTLARPRSPCRWGVTPCSARQSLSSHRSAYFRSGAARSSMI